MCRRLPLVDVRWQPPRPAPASGHPGADGEDAEAEEPALVLSVELKRLRGAAGGGHSRVYAPRFPKVRM